MPEPDETRKAYFAGIEFMADRHRDRAFDYEMLAMLSKTGGVMLPSLEESMADTGTISTTWAVFSVLGGTVVGGAISTIVAFAIQKRGLAAAKKQRDEDRHETRRAQAYSLFFKMIRIHSTIVLIERSIRESIDRANKAGFEGDPWQKVIPFGNLPDKVKFTADEMGLVLLLDNNLFNDIGPYDDIHNSLIDITTLYGQKRVAMMEKFGAKMISGSRGVTERTKEEAEWMAPREYELNALVRDMIERAKHDSEESRGLLVRLHDLFVKEYGLNPKLEFKPPS